KRTHWAMLEMADQSEIGGSRRASTEDWLGYAPTAGASDEVFESSGQVRPHWSGLLESLVQLGLPELTRRWEEAQHLIRENGITYNVYGDPRGMERPWQLDPIPLLISPAEAKDLEAGLVQRGRLLEALGQDLYGPQRCLAEGYLPPELLFPNPAFLRSCHGMCLPQRRMLHLYAANIGRTSAGGFCVLGDRTQSPSGAGYGLENRIVLSRVLPDSFLGVPGLVQAVHANNVAVANALGTGLLETPALLAFLPGLCPFLLGEELKLPSVPTWWCGEPRACDHVLTHLSEMVIKPA